MRRTGTRQMKLSEFLLGSYETALEPGELLSALVSSAARRLARHLHQVHHRFFRRDGHAPASPHWYAWNKAYVEIFGLVVGAVSPRPVRMHHAEEFGAAKKFTEAVLQSDRRRSEPRCRSH